jgi:hypothetical protein
MQSHLRIPHHPFGQYPMLVVLANLYQLRQRSRKKFYWFNMESIGLGTPRNVTSKPPSEINLEQYNV